MFTAIAAIVSIPIAMFPIACMRAVVDLCVWGRIRTPTTVEISPATPHFFGNIIFLFSIKRKREDYSVSLIFQMGTRTCIQGMHYGFESFRHHITTLCIKSHSEPLSSNSSPNDTSSRSLSSSISGCVPIRNPLP